MKKRETPKKKPRVVEDRQLANVKGGTHEAEVMNNPLY
jgi:hypothetical protein